MFEQKAKGKLENKTKNRKWKWKVKYDFEPNKCRRQAMVLAGIRWDEKLREALEKNEVKQNKTES